MRRLEDTILGALYALMLLATAAVLIAVIVASVQLASCWIGEVL